MIRRMKAFVPQMTIYFYYISANVMQLDTE